MARNRRNKGPNGRQVLEVQRMLMDLIATLDSDGVRRILESQDVLSALAEGRLTPKQALASLGLPVTNHDGATDVFDLFGLHKDAESGEVIRAFERQGMRPATAGEYDRFSERHPEIIEALLVRARLNMVMMGERVPMRSRNQREECWGYTTYSLNSSGEVQMYIEDVDCVWDRSCRFLGVRLDARPSPTAIQVVSAINVSSRVRPSA